MCVFRDNDIEESGLELDFTTDFEVLGKVEHHDLKEGGADLKVTEENKKEYIEYAYCTRMANLGVFVSLLYFSKFVYISTLE